MTLYKCLSVVGATDYSHSPSPSAARALLREDSMAQALAPPADVVLRLIVRGQWRKKRLAVAVRLTSKASSPVSSIKFAPVTEPTPP